MSRVLVSGLINVETTVRVEGFPIEYSPVRYPFFGVDTRISGVGYNLAKALTKLGDEVIFLSIIGADPMGDLVRQALRQDGIDDVGVLTLLERTPESVILYDPSGRRQINVDLKDIQEAVYPSDHFEEAARGADLLALCNINFSRPFLGLGRDLGKRVATDVHVISDLDDPYNRDFMAAADLLFMSNEGLPCAPERWLEQVRARFDPEVAVVGLGGEGAILWEHDQEAPTRLGAVRTREVVNTIGAGDALFSAFVHGVAPGGEPRRALERAMVFASYKIGASGAAEGFLDQAGLNDWIRRISV